MKLSTLTAMADASPPSAAARPAKGAAWPTNAGTARPATADADLIPGIRGSVLHRTCVEIYRRHSADGDGACPTCQRPMPCPPRTFAARVIEVAGDNARLYDSASVRPPAPAVRDEPAGEPVMHALPGGVVGYALGGAGRVQAPYHDWDR